MRRKLSGASRFVLAAALLSAVSGSLPAQSKGDHGITAGAIVETTSDYLLVRAPGDLPQRIYFQSGAKPDASLKPGDNVEVAWTFDEQRGVDSIKPIAAPPPAPPAPVAEHTAPTPLVASAPPDTDSSTGQRVNAMIDDLIAVAERLMQLPTFVVVGFAGVVVIGLLLAMRWFGVNSRYPRLAVAARVTMVGLVLLTLLFVVDRKISQLQDEVRDLRLRLSSNALTAASATDRPARLPGKRDTYLFDLAAAQQALTAQFGSATLKPQICDQAVDFVPIELGNPMVKASLAVIDLRYPNVSIKLGVDLGTKTLTSAFAREQDCIIAINGEAGASPGPYSGLGSWRGHLIQDGKVILQEQPQNTRPFLSFDRESRVKFVSAAAPDRAAPGDAYNLIWGRWDVLVNGEVAPTTMRDRQPRTAMAINRDGSRLYLLVIDGRQPRYSVGMTRSEAGQLLKALGASDGMLCDEGGSSCMYVKNLNGIANIPSDNQGKERVTYTHFGVVVAGD